MAVSVESSNLVWQKVKIALETLKASELVKDAFRRLKMDLATLNGNPDLEFVPFSAAQVVTNTGYSPIGAACKVYAVYAKNAGAGDGTDSFLTLHDAADNTSAGTIGAPIQDDKDEILYIEASRGGIAFATDLTISAATALAGATESAEANACDGFVIIGAA